MSWAFSGKHEEVWEPELFANTAKHERTVEGFEIFADTTAQCGDDDGFESTVVPVNLASFAHCRHLLVLVVSCAYFRLSGWIKSMALAES
jgi:hypothetical protein